MEEFDHVLKEMMPRYNNGEWELAQGVLDKFVVQKGDGLDAELRQKCEWWTALIFVDAGKPDQALAIYQQHFEATKENVPQFTLVVRNYVELLNATGRASKAVEVLENVFSRPLSFHMQDTLWLMTAYAAAAQKIQDRFLETSHTVLPGIIEALDLPNHPLLADLSQPSATINHLTAMHKAGNRRFASLMVMLPNLPTAAERNAAVQSFIDNEAVGYYRDMAKEYLSDAS